MVLSKKGLIIIEFRHNNRHSGNRTHHENRTLLIAIEISESVDIDNLFYMRNSEN